MKILIVDDHAVVRQGYASLLAGMLDGCEIIEAGSGEEAVELCRESKPDIIIMDINLPGISGIEAAGRIRDLAEKPRILFFSMYDEASVVKHALDAGGMGYISKSGSPKILLDAVAALTRGEVFIEYDLVMKLASSNNRDHEDRLRQLTQREYEVFVMLVKGESTQHIAEHLEISSKTVSNYITLLKTKLGISSTAALVHFGIDAGIVKLPPRFGDGDHA
ncbi:response regulator transcription factor [Pontibacter sp. JAM-7]|uniref:response regulator transcription factor n=1 Tax=Pontibacter sp. JAM-7 TaxID=3366581 RepID=UPI003AF76128